MPNYLSTWKAAKQKFENATGLKKPTETMKVFSVEVRKSAGVESALKAVDKAVPDNLLEPLSTKAIKAIAKAVAEADAAGTKYLKVLETHIEKEKKGPGGKEASAIYRDLKILRAELEAIIAGAKSDVAKAYASRESLEKEVSKMYRNTFITIKTLAEGIERTSKEALVYAQAILKNPTPQQFNSSFDTAARNLTQNLANVRKWTMPSEIDPVYQKKRLEALEEDSKIAEAVHDLYHTSEKCKRAVLPLLAQRGNSPLNADLARMANNPPRFPEDTTKEDVIAATKHFVAQVKECLRIAGELKKG